MRLKHGHHLDHVDLHALLIEVWNRLAKGESVTASPDMLWLADAIWERLADDLNVHLNRFSRQYFQDLFGLYHRWVVEPRPPIAGATYLDLGCGSVNSLGVSMLMCMLGAKRCIGVDLDVVQDVPRAARGLARLVDAMLQDPTQIVGPHPITRDQIIDNLHGIDVAKLRKGDLSGTGSRLSVRNESATNLSLEDGSIDVVLSNSFFEHIEEVDSVLAEVARVTVKGGFGIHGIDGVDHRWYANNALHRLDFLRNPGPGMLYGCNRIRPLEYPAYFQRHGFAVQQIAPLLKLSLTPQEIAEFAPPWSTMTSEVLEMAGAIFVTRKV